MIWFLIGFFGTGFIVLKFFKMVFWDDNTNAAGAVANVSLEEYMYGTAYDNEVEFLEEERRSERMQSAE